MALLFTSLLTLATVGLHRPSLLPAGVTSTPRSTCHGVHPLVTGRREAAHSLSFNQTVCIDLAMWFMTI
jgi:hypothetical protein